MSAQFVEALLYGVDVHEVSGLVAAALLVALTGLIGVFIPAHSAAKPDPAAALRAE